MIDFKHLVKAFGFAFNGILHAVKYDQNMRIHFMAGILVIIASIFFQVTPFEMGILGIITLLVIVTEMINTAIENMVDLITKEHREEARIAKDVGSGMVLLTAMGSIIVAALIFLPHIFKMLHIVW